MSLSSRPRIKRGSGPSGKLRDHNVPRRAWEYLLKDFEGRCAYSMRHIEIAGGERHMEVDHFDPTIRGAERNRYDNLMLSTKHCNLMKRDRWPTASERKAGCVLIDPCSECDYGKHIFEDPDTHLLVGSTTAGRYQIDVCDLNHPTFVLERTNRATFLALTRGKPKTFAGSFIEIGELLGFVNRHFELFIPEIPPPPASSSSP